MTAPLCTMCLNPMRLTRSLSGCLWSCDDTKHCCSCQVYAIPGSAYDRPNVPDGHVHFEFPEGVHLDGNSRRETMTWSIKTKSCFQQLVVPCTLSSLRLDGETHTHLRSTAAKM